MQKRQDFVQLYSLFHPKDLYQLDLLLQTDNQFTVFQLEEKPLNNDGRGNNGHTGANNGIFATQPDRYGNIYLLPYIYHVTIFIQFLLIASNFTSWMTAHVLTQFRNRSRRQGFSCLNLTRYGVKEVLVHSYCCPDRLSCPASAIQMGQAT